MRDDRPIRVLFCTTPLDGHFRPLLPLARALRGAGHEIVFVTEATWHPHIVAEGFDALPAGRPHAEISPISTSSAPRFWRCRRESGGRICFRRIFAEGHATSKLPELLEVAARAWQPQAIVYESGDLAAPAVAAVLELRAANHSFGVMVPFAASAYAAEHMAAAVALRWASSRTAMPGPSAACTST